MKVVIIKSSKNQWWYNNLIGHVFNVQEELKSDCYVVKDGNYKEWGIKEEDAAILKEEKINSVDVPTKEQILKAAAKSPQAKEVLKELFPDVLKEGIIIPNFVVHVEGNLFLGKSSIYDGKIFLSPAYNWNFHTLKSTLYLAPTKK